MTSSRLCPGCHRASPPVVATSAQTLTMARGDTSQVALSRLGSKTPPLMPAKHADSPISATGGIRDAGGAAREFAPMDLAVFMNGLGSLTGWVVQHAQLLIGALVALIILAYLMSG